MSVETLTLYGPNLYGAVTYSDYEAPQTTNVSLSDTQASSDSDVFDLSRFFSDTQASSDNLVLSVAKVLSDSLSSSDSKIATLSKLFADSLSMSDVMDLNDIHNQADSISVSDSTLTKIVEKVFNEITTHGQTLYGPNLYGPHLYAGDLLDAAIFMVESFFIAVQRNIADNIIVTDSTVHIQQTKGYSDFFILQEWINIQLIKANPWQKQVVGFPSVPSLYGVPLYGQALYSDRAIMIWTPPVFQPNPWTNADGHNNQED